MSDAAGLRAAAAAWLEADPDPRTRAELVDLLAAAETDPAAEEELRGRFDGRLRFGTAGLRAPLGAGPARMNRVVVRCATAAVMATLPPGARVVVAHDARRNSDVFAADAAALVAAAGGEALLLGEAPTPVAAHAVMDRGAHAGIVITASHNPPGDNGYKLYGADGVQIVPPVDADVEAHMAAAPLPPRQPPPPSGAGVVRRIGSEATERYLAAITRRLQQRPPEAPSASSRHSRPPLRHSGEGMSRTPIREPVPDPIRGRNPLPGDPTCVDEPRSTAGAPPRVVYTPLHGVGAPVLLALFDRLGLPAPMVVPSQAAPDGDFPTVAFPNPEEPGALDAAYALATEQGADLVIANDPDADRLAVAELAATADQGSDHPAWRRLTGDELGVLLADCLLRRRAATGDAEPVLLAASVVSSQMLRAMAADAGAAYAATLTGFKWIARAAQGRAERLLFGYEEALGYAVCDEVRDKDGISAAALAVQLATALRAEGSSLAERLDDLYRHHGVYATGQLTVRFPAAEAAAGPAAATDRLRADPPAEIAAQPVVSVTDYLVAPARGPAAESGVAGEWIPASAGMTKRRAGVTRRRAGITKRRAGITRSGPPHAAHQLPATDMLVFGLGGDDRVIVRPSGTEPKLKIYVETTDEVRGGDLGAARRRAQDRLGKISEAMRTLTAEPKHH